MSMFGWSYPPGCNGPPEDDQLHPKSEEVQAILEDAGVDQLTIDRVIVIVDRLILEAKRGCPRCLEAAARELKEDRGYL